MNHPIIHNKDHARQADIAAILVTSKLISNDATWTRLSGGKTNICWRVTTPQQDLACKLYFASNENPLFPNDPSDELCALEQIARIGLAPRPVSLENTPFGTCVLYEYLEGDVHTEQNVDIVAQALATLHEKTPISNTRLRRLPVTPSQIAEHGNSILEMCKSKRANWLHSLGPQIPDLTPSEPVFLHGDFVPANIIHTGQSVKFIDWQCPAIGDPCEDISTFLSPAMQSLYSDNPLNGVRTERFLLAYGNSDITNRYLALAPLYHWRMAAYCLWKSLKGAEEYSAALELEIQALSASV